MKARDPILLLGIAASLSFACREQPMKIELDAPGHELRFNSRNDVTTLKVVVRDADGVEIAKPEITWSSSNPRVAEVTKEGRVIPKLDGRALITIRSGFAQISVPAVVHLYAAIIPSTTAIHLSPQESEVVSATVVDAEGVRMTAPLVWRSKNNDVATVEDGVVSAVSVGDTEIEVTAKHLTRRLPVSVGAPTASM
jgi:hypothetical protein